jgi:hypothetical protein
VVRFEPSTSSTTPDLYHFAWGFVRKSNKKGNLLKFSTNIPPFYRVIKNTANVTNVQIVSKTASFSEPHPEINHDHEI